MKKIFFAYSDNAQDVELYREFNKHFKTYARNGILAIVDKDELFRVSGDSGKAEQFLQESDIAVPLLSVDYLTNEQCIKLIDAAVAGKKTIIPVLLRDCNYDSVDGLKAVEDKLLPADGQSVVEYKNEGALDEILSSMARKVKEALLKELGTVVIRKNSGMFYYILSGVILVLGGLAASYCKSEWGDWRLAAGVFLMFLIIALFPLKQAVFPTKLNVG